MKNNIISKKQNDYPNSFGSVVDNMFNTSLRHFFEDNFWDSNSSLMTGRVPVNVRETDDKYELEVIAPGCRKEDFNISINDRVLTISFNTSEQNQEQGEKVEWVRNEFIQRSFSRSFTLDDTVDVNNINATYNDGILRLSMAKNEKAKKISRTIEIG